MAATYTPLQAMNFAKRFIMNMPLDDADIKIPILQAASNEVHLYAPWRWSVGNWTVTQITNSTEDVTVTDPGDVLFGLHGELRFKERERVVKLDFVTGLPATPVAAPFVGTPTVIENTTTTNLRLSPLPKMDASDLPYLYAWYKKVNIRIQESGTETTLVKNDDNAAAVRIPDEWFWVYEQVVLKHAYQFSADPRWADQVEYVERLKGFMFEKEKPLMVRDLGVRDVG